MSENTRLKDILQGVDYKLIDGSTDIEVAGLASDSKMVKSGFIFVAIKGSRYDGHNFIEEAKKIGAKAIIAEGDFSNDNKEVTKILVSNSRKALANIAHNFYGRPADNMRLVGITGTNGKTTISYLTEAVLKEAGFAVGVIGTINYRYGPRQIPAANTTPDALQLSQTLRYMLNNGATHLIMEVSSHSLEQYRVYGINFKTAVFTNITP